MTDQASTARARERQRARRILERVTFRSPECTLIASMHGENRGLYDRSVLNISYLLSLAEPLPRRLRRKHAFWIRTVRDERVRLYRELQMFGQPSVPLVEDEECLGVQQNNGAIADGSAL